MNKKLGLKLVPVVMAVLVTSSTQAGMKGLFKDIFPAGKRLDPASAMALLRAEFTNAGITLNIDTPYLMGKTPDGEVCSVNVQLLVNPMKGDPDSADMNLYVGDRTARDNSKDPSYPQGPEAVFLISSDDPTFEIRQLGTSNNQLSLAAVFVQAQNFKTFAGQPYIPEETVHRSIQITTDASNKIVSIHMADESTDQTCILN